MKHPGDSGPQLAGAEGSAQVQSLGSSCWYTGEFEAHPNTECPKSGQPIPVATEGRVRWVACKQCGRNWELTLNAQRSATSAEAVGSAIPKWVADEIRMTWFVARSCGSDMRAFRLFERMTDRLGFGRTENNPSLVPGLASPNSQLSATDA